MSNGFEINGLNLNFNGSTARKPWAACPYDGDYKVVANMRGLGSDCVPFVAQLDAASVTDREEDL